VSSEGRVRDRALAAELELPDGWRVRETSGLWPFVTRAVLERPDGSTVEWTSRRHRKRLGLRLAARLRSGARRWSRPSRSSIAMGTLFAAGSACFALGSLPAYSDHVSIGTDAWTFFAGSVLFTSAAYLQYREAIVVPSGPDDGASVPRGLRRIVAWAPHRIDWWASTIQLVGTVFFNVSTLAATHADLAVVQERRWIWVPDVAGSICFLVASWLAYAEAGAGEHGLRGRSVGWWISASNLLGSIAFGLAAVASRYLHATGEIANIALVNLGTFVGAVCFFIGAVLLPVESARDSVPALAPA
jgi:hypothetical protein